MEDLAPAETPTTGTPATDTLTIDELAAAAGTTTRRVRSLQTLGLLPHPALRGRTGLYGHAHEERLGAVLRLQAQGFSLESLRVLFAAHDAGRSLASVLYLAVDTEEAYGEAPGTDPAPTHPEPLGAAPEGEDVAAPEGEDVAALYGFVELQPPTRGSRQGPLRPVLSLVPTTVWDHSQAS